MPLRPLPPVPFLPGHVSTEAERTAFRTLADAVWERHSAAVTRVLTRMPALRGPEQEAARTDLVALHVYLDTSYDPGPVGALPLGAGAPRPADGQYVIWSVTGPRTRQPTDRPTSAGPTSGGDEVVFVPGTLLRILDVRDTDGTPLALLREVPEAAPSRPPPVRYVRLDDHDRAAIDRLDEALRRHPVDT